jgi:hypothetical protein
MKHNVFEQDERDQGTVLSHADQEAIITMAKQSNVGKVLIGLILIAFGIFELVAPETSWYLFRGWAYKNLEPSDAALIVARVGGGIAVFIGIGFLLPL